MSDVEREIIEQERRVMNYLREKSSEAFGENNLVTLSWSVKISYLEELCSKLGV